VNYNNDNDNTRSKSIWYSISEEWKIRQFPFSIFPPPLLDGGGVFTVEVHSPSGWGEVGKL